MHLSKERGVVCLIHAVYIYKTTLFLYARRSVMFWVLRLDRDSSPDPLVITITYT